MLPDHVLKTNDDISMQEEEAEQVYIGSDSGES